MRRLIQSIPFGGQIQAGLGELHAHLATQPDVERGFNVGVYLSPTFEVGARVEIGVEVGQRFEASSEVRRLELLQGSVARTVHRGPYHELGRAHQALRDWAECSDSTLAGPHWEIYGHWTNDESRLETDVVYLLHDG